MSLYVFMGTNLPEIAHCFDYLANFEPEAEDTRFCIPAGLEGCFPQFDKAALIPYESDNNDWEWISDTGGRSFLLIDPRISPVPQLEALAIQLKSIGSEPDKISTFVDCHAAEQSVQVRSFLEACIYYSDIALLGNRQEISKAFLRNFQKEYERNCFPCLFLLLKGKGVPGDPVELLTSGVRRISQIFDLPDNQEDMEISPLIEASCDLDLEEIEKDPYRSSEESPAPNASVPDVNPWIVKNSD